MNVKKIAIGSVGALALAAAAYFGYNNFSNPVTPNGANLITSSNLAGNLDTNNYTVYVTPHGKKYHKDTCGALKLSKKTSISHQEALDNGYEACKRCKPDEGRTLLPNPKPETKNPQEQPETKTPTSGDWGSE